MSETPHGFVHLQLHSEFSLLDGAIQIKRLLNECEKNSVQAVALTDNGNLFGAIDFYFGAKSKGVKPIIGCEIGLTDDMSVKQKTQDRLVLLCRNEKGYENLCHVVSKGHIDGFYYKPRVDMACLKEHCEGIIAISPGYWGPIAQLLQMHFLDHAKDKALELKDVFGDQFYFGLQRTGEVGVDQIASDIIELSNDIQVPLVALNDVYFIKDDEGWMQDMLHCIKTGREIDIDDQNNAKRSQHYMKSAEEMVTLFSDVPDAIKNTVKIAEQCQFEMVADQVLLPKFECPDGLSPEDYLEQLVWDGVKQKYSIISDEIKDRVSFEMGIINRMKYPIYFLIIHDFLKFCTDSDIPVGPGRGSAAGSIVAYALNITRIDPIKYNLLFERFLNPERVTMPDIDIDFCIKRRSEVIKYISEKYGDDHVAQIATFGTMAARGVIRDVGRSLGIPLDQVDRVAKLIPSAPGHNMSIKEAIDEVADLGELYEKDSTIAKLLNFGMKLEGFARHSSTHAAGVVISKDPLSKMVPLMNNDGQITTHYTMNNLEKLGLLKMDILGLRNLTVIYDACGLIQKEKPDFDIDKINVDDKVTYDLFSSGASIGIFQCESQGMRRLVMDLKPQTFEDIIALLALYRPGPLGSGMVNDFISNKSGETEVKYDTPELEPILSDTYGMIVYQEQVMQIASDVGGFTLGEADMLRRAMGKKKKDVMDQMKDQFLAGAEKKDIDPKKAEKIFDLCYKFAEYGFNKSHSAAYALISYQTAYLKAHFPEEYLVALMSSMLGNTDRMSMYVSEVRRLGITIVPPNVNLSLFDHHLDNHKIYYGLGGVKGIGEAPVLQIIDERKSQGDFVGPYDFFSRLKGKDVNKRVVEHLIKAGALDCLGCERAKLLDCYEEIIEKMNISSRYSNQGQIGLFQTLDEDIYTEIINQANANFHQLELLRYEKELTGEYLSAHPLDDYVDVWKAGLAIEHITEAMEKEMVEITGILGNVVHRISKNNRPFSMADIEDFTGKINVMMFDSPKYEQISAQLKDSVIVKLKGKVRFNHSECTIMIEDIVPISSKCAQKICHVDILDSANIDQLHQIKQISVLNRGNIALYFHIQETVIDANKKYWVKDDAIPMIQSILGEDRVWIEQ